ncbi:MAG: hypothetical protein PVJ86_13915 [Phycisphaerales bacterium]|jgi:hypothetical protein
MVTDNQVRILMKLVNQEKLLKTAAAKAGMSEKTARKYRKSGKLPSLMSISANIASTAIRKSTGWQLGKSHGMTVSSPVEIVYWWST